MPNLLLKPLHMKKQLLCLFIFFCGIWASSTAQFQPAPQQIIGMTPVLQPNSLQTRSASQPKKCSSDTVQFTAYGSTAYNTISIRTGSSLGQFFGAPQTLTVQGFKFYAYAIPTNPARKFTIQLRCNIYKAGADSLPTGNPLASDTIEVDTVMGSSIPLARIERLAWFSKPLTLSDAYIVVLECDSANVSAGVVSNSWNAGNGRKRNLACGSVSGRWYRALSLNVGGITLDADMQFYPVVKYDFGTDFLSNYTCYPNDTLRFTNQYKKNISSSIFYNYYVYYNLSQFSHRWNYGDGSFDYYQVDGKIKYATKKNYDVRLISTVYQYKGAQCIDTTIKKMWFRPDLPQLNGKNQFCKGDSAVLEVYSNPDAVIKWYKKPSDSTAIFTGLKYIIPNIQKADTFYIKAINGDCQSAFLVLTAKVNEYPNDPTIISDSICSGGAATLQAISNLGTAEWFRDSLATKFVKTGEYLITGKLNADTTLFVRINNAGCLNKGGIGKAQVKVGSSFAPSIPQLLYDTFHCFRSLQLGVKIKAIANAGDTIRWYDKPIGGALRAKGDSIYYMPIQRGQYMVYVESWNGVCASGRASAFMVINDYPDIYNKKSFTGCENQLLKPSAEVSFGEIEWYLDKNSAGFPIQTGSNPVLPPLPPGNRYVYLRSNDGFCAMPHFDSIPIVINKTPVATSVIADAVCFKGLGKATVNIASGTVNWYFDTAQASIFTGKIYQAGLMLGNVDLFYQIEDKGCKSPFKEITIPVKPRPTAGFQWELRWKNRLVCTPISTSNMTFSWNWGDGKTSGGLPAVHDYASEGDYTVRLVTTSTINGCKDTADIPVSINHMGIGSDLLKSQLTIGPNPVHAGEALEINGFKEGSEVIFKWFLSDGKQINAEKQRIDGKRHLLDIPSRLPSGTAYLWISVGGESLIVPILILP